MRRSRLAIGGVVAVLVTGVAAGRVFAPADTLDRSHLPQPVPVTAEAQVYGELMSAPLLVGTRMRVYAGDNRVWADAPVDARLGTSALWAYRRWPARVVGVVVTGHTVVSKWSDGALVAIDADQRRVAWRATGPVGATSYQGRRTGARTVYDPPDLFLGTAFDGRTVLVSTGRQGVTAFDAGSGATLWHHDGGGPAAAGGCLAGFTAPGLFVVGQRCLDGNVVADDLATGQVRLEWSWPSAGGLQPVGCALGHSQCTGLGDEIFQPNGALIPARGLTADHAVLAGRLAIVTTPGGAVVATDAVTGDRRWSWDGFAGEGVRILAVEPDVVHVLTEGHGMVTLNLADGLLRSWVPLQIEGEDDGWKPGYVYAAHGFLAIERLLPDGRPDQPDTAYYYGFPTMMFTGS